MRSRLQLAWPRSASSTPRHVLPGGSSSSDVRQVKNWKKYQPTGVGLLQLRPNEEPSTDQCIMVKMLQR
jgi:hypothetical protein